MHSDKVEENSDLINRPRSVLLVNDLRSFDQASRIGTDYLLDVILLDFPKFMMHIKQLTQIKPQN